MSATLPILNAFKAHLTPLFSGWDVQLMPKDTQRYFLAHPNGAILISYAGSTFGDVRPSAAITQMRTVHIVFTVLSRDLHNDQGALQLLDNLRLAVVGFTPPNCSPSWLIEEQFDEQQEGIWIYQLVLATQTMQIQQMAEPSAQYPFKHLEGKSAN